MFAQCKKLTVSREFCLATLTLLALLTHAVTTNPDSLTSLAHCHDEALPQLRLTGMRYYLRKHGRLSPAPPAESDVPGAPNS